MVNYSAWSALPRALQQGMQAFQEAKAAKIAAERQAQQDAMQKQMFDLTVGDKTPNLPNPFGGSTPVTRPEAFAAEQEKAKLDNALKLSRAKGSGAPAGMKLKPGERYNAETDTVEIVPGSDLYQSNALKHQKDMKGVQSGRESAAAASAKVDSLLSDPDFSKQFGGWNAYGSQYLAPGAMQKVEDLKSSLMSQGLQLMKAGGGIGQISEKEWPIMEGLIHRLSPKMSEEQAKQALEEIKIRFNNIRDQADEAYQNTWGNTQFSKPMRTGKTQSTPAQESWKRYKILAVE